MALADEIKEDQLQFRPSRNVAAALLRTWGPAPVMTAFGPVSVKPPEQIFSSAQDATAKSPIEVTQDSIGERIERMLATLASHNAAQAQSLIVTEHNQFTAPVAQQVLLRLQIPQAASALLNSLAEDLRAAVADAPMRRNWGELCVEGERLVLHPAPLQAVAPALRAPAKVVRQTMIE